MVNYSKWDHLDSSDEESTAPTTKAPILAKGSIGKRHVFVDIVSDPN